MYSIVMMTALTAAPDTPQFNGFFRDLFCGDGCNGCSGAVQYNGCGGCSGSMYASSCTGCCGSCNGSVFGLGLGSRMRSFFAGDPVGCCGGHSYSYGCCGASYSCSGSAYSCFGGLSCQGGMPYSAPPPTFGPAPMFSQPGTPGVPYAVPAPAPDGVGFRPAAYTGSALVSNGPTARAVVVVRVPSDARLLVDGRALNLTGAERKFVSPELPTNQEFVYRFKAEYERDGETVSVTKKVMVRGGVTATVEFTDLTAAKAAPAGSGATAAGSGKGDKGLVPSVKPAVQEPVKTEPPIKPAPASDPPASQGADRATITVKLPPGATLYVDDRRSPSHEPVRSFATPPLPAGREFAYLIKAEVVRNGQPETFTQKVPFRAGERVVVDFTSMGK